MKKKTLFVVVLACALVLCCVALAGAKYAGYAYNNPIVTASGTAADNPYPGYLSWSGANIIYNRNVPGGTHMTTAHGDYVSSTTKCAVCHSAHRAYSASASVAGVTPTDLSLTSGGGCLGCHTTWGGGAANKKIEWADLYTDPNAGGPHASFNCTSNCHSGGVHGGSDSTYNGMNAYMLGSDKDAAITTAFAAGNVSDNITYTPGAVAGSGGTGAAWFQSGSTGTPSDGNPPDTTTGIQFAAAKAMATGYTCAQSGCHGASQFAVNVWGFSQMHASKPTAITTLDMPFTGHATGAMSQNIMSSTGGCGPCHPGNAAGGFRTVAGHSLANAYGCDQCHDVVGQATGTTAFPHGNRNITVYQWDSTGAISSVDIGTGKNLWMYQADISATTNSAADQIDKSFTVVQNAAAWSSAGPGNINDGVCLKCHVPIDSASLASRGITNGTIYPATGHTHDATMINGVFTNSTTPDNFIFTWK